ncbi:binding-protein-dependent transport systems inner membrane component [Gordonia neofelifaecis NRRL B-59395]|uniref:Binding-protein-dependent transport systems inner membrane component n=1 Tax=Gordonia neofelifaecis NRRL B-59395 TaxID=644548 RepID=F1YKN8_9ACTN|nr:binding-protein-dependent transport systems inner membrane component [Gordonia neofelifaecis NRRL B-59395]
MTITTETPATGAQSPSAEPDSATAAPPGPTRRSLPYRAGYAVAVPLASVLVFAGLWQLAASSGLWSTTFVPPLGSIWRAFVEVSTTHDGVRGYGGYLLSEHLYMTVRRVFFGVTAGVVVGVALGTLMGLVGWLRRLVEPWLTFLRGAAARLLLPAGHLAGHR